MATSEAKLELITNPDDFAGAFKACAAAFGHQTHDGVWMSFNPGWDTPEGEKAGAKRLVDRWSSVTKNRVGQPNTIFIKATVDNVIAGVSIWQQFSVVDGYGDAPVEDIRKSTNLDELHPGNESEQRFLQQAERSLHKRRWEIIKEKATASPPAVLVMDLCVVDPAFQKRGIAKKLVQWGLDEAERRGGLESITEASSMGRVVYIKQGFKQEGGEIVYEMDDEFKGRDVPSNVVLRTGGQ
ncbi:hypothetical protein ACHAPJ_005611 [Fusarium lateritium]